MSDAIDYGPGEHCLILGQTQSGKSVIATTIAAGVDYGCSLVIVDSKGDPDAILPNCHLTRSASDVIRQLPGRVIWQPARTLGARQLAADLDRICLRLLQLAERGRSAVLLIHELGDFADAHRYGSALRQVITQGGKIAGGAELGGGHVGGIFVSQRPVNIPVIARSEMRHVICLALESAEDRATAAAMMEDILFPIESRRAVASSSRPLDRTWWYRGPDHRLRQHAPVAPRR